MKENIVRYFDYLMNIRLIGAAFRVTLLLLFIYFIHSVVMLSILYFVFPNIFENETVYTTIPQIISNLIFWVTPFIPTLFFVVLIEELLFRLPISLFINRKIKSEYKVAQVFFISFLFGVYHMVYFDFQEIITVFYPTFITGLLFSIVYIIFGANQGKMFKPFIAVFILHFVLNFINFTILGIPN